MKRITLIIALYINVIYSQTVYDVILAVKSHDIERVKELIPKKVDISTPYFHGISILHYAVYKNDLDIVKYLVENGADVNTKSKDGNTPLHDAIKWANIDIVKYLVENGADVSIKDKGGYNYLEAALLNSKLKIAQYIASKGVKVQKINKYKLHLTSLHYYAIMGNLEKMKHLTKKSKKYKNVNLTDKFKNTPLHYAVVLNRTEVVKFLLKKKADVNLKNAEGLSSLDYAKLGDNKELITLLEKRSK